MLSTRHNAVTAFVRNAGLTSTLRVYEVPLYSTVHLQYCITVDLVEREGLRLLQGPSNSESSASCALPCLVNSLIPATAVLIMLSVQYLTFPKWHHSQTSRILYRCRTRDGRYVVHTCRPRVGGGASVILRSCLAANSPVGMY